MKRRTIRKTKQRTIRKTKRKVTPRKQLTKIRSLSPKKYKRILRKKRLSAKEKRSLNRSLFKNYCKCIKKIKYSKNVSKGLEYPICMKSIYSQRGIKPPRNVQKECKKYR